MRAVLTFLVVCGCGGAGSPPAKPLTPPPATPARPAGAALTADVVCKRVVELQAAKCGRFATITGDCLAEFKTADEDPSSKALMQSVGHCVIDNVECNQVMNCLAAVMDAQPAGAPQALRACNEPDAPGSVGIPKAEWDKRNGTNITKYSHAKSSKALPVEICGIPEENAWLGSLTCNDGSRPIKNSADAETFRKGNVGTAGRCGSIVDLYSVKCPEKSYDLYIDAYICALPK
jgi:hypothetical protein